MLHELRTPLQIIQGHLNLIQRWGKQPRSIRRIIDISIEEMERITKLVEELLLLSKDPRTSASDDTISWILITKYNHESNHYVPS